MHRTTWLATYMANRNVAYDAVTLAGPPSHVTMLWLLFLVSGPSHQQLMRNLSGSMSAYTMCGRPLRFEVV